MIAKANSNTKYITNTLKQKHGTQVFPIKLYTYSMIFLYTVHALPLGWQFLNMQNQKQKSSAQFYQSAQVQHV